MKIEFRYTKDAPSADRLANEIARAASTVCPDAALEVETLDRSDALTYSMTVNGEPMDLDIERFGVVPPTWYFEAVLLRATKPKGMLFLCVANSARSQIGEGVAGRLAPKDVRVQSAGSKPTKVRAEAAAVLAEIGVDTGAHFSKNVTDIDPSTVDTVITLCAEEECPVFLGKAVRLHWGLPDPAAVVGDEETRLDAFRAARDELMARLELIWPSTDTN